MKKISVILILLATVIIVSVSWYSLFPPRLSDNGFNVILAMDGSKLLSDTDILSYNLSSHTLTLTDECVDRMKKMKEPLTGDFIITIHGEEDLQGIIVPPIVSRSYPPTEMVIIYPSIHSDYKTMKIQMGYPWDQPTDYDPRQDSKMKQYFDSYGKLTR